MTPQEMVLEFHQVFGCDIDVRDEDSFTFRRHLLLEEFDELMEEFYDVFSDFRNGYGLDLTKMAKEMADLAYVLYGLAVTAGIDLDKAIQLVHKSNMTKLWPDGRPRVREDGKILKPPGHQDWDVSETVKEL